MIKMKKVDAVIIFALGQTTRDQFYALSFMFHVQHT